MKKGSDFDVAIHKAMRMGMCAEGRRWLLSLPAGTTPEIAWNEATRGPWLMWLVCGLVERLAIDRSLSIIGACAAAKAVSPPRAELAILSAAEATAMRLRSHPDESIEPFISAWRKASPTIPEGRTRHAVMSLASNHDFVVASAAELAACSPRDQRGFGERLGLVIGWGTYFAYAAAADWRTGAQDAATAAAIREAVPWSVVETGLASVGWEG